MKKHLRLKEYHGNMPKFKLNKLVRDKIIEHQIKAGTKPFYRLLDSKDHKRELINKLIEEAREVLVVEEKNVASEIADVQQALDDLIEQYKLKKSDILAHQERKKQENGTFKKGIYIDYIDILEDDPFTDYYRSEPDRFPEISD